MQRKQESKWNLEDLTDADVWTTIHYLDPDSIPETNAKTNGTLFLVCFSILVLVSGFSALLSLYHRVLVK